MGAGKCELSGESNATAAELDIVQQVRNLCPPPEVALQVIELARDPDVELKRLSRVIELDPTFTAQLLRTVNSAKFGLSARVNTVQAAVLLLGLKSLRLLSTALGLLNPLSARLPHALYQRYWRKSLTVALLARELTTSADDPCVFFTAGLVSNIGVLAFVQVDGTAYQKVYQQLHAQPKELLAAEQVRFGTDHFRVGGHMLATFGLDSCIVEAIRSLNDSNPDRASGSLLAKTLHAAQELSDLLVQGDRDQWNRLGEQLLRDFHLDTDKLLTLLSRVAAELNDWATVFNLNVPQADEATFREIAAAALADLSIQGALDLSIMECQSGPLGN